MTDSIIDIINRCNASFILNNKKDNLHCIITIFDRKTFKQKKYMLSFNEDGIVLFSHPDKIFLEEHKYDFDILKSLILNILKNTYFYREIDRDDSEAFKKTKILKWIMARIIFRNMDDKYFNDFRNLLFFKKKFINKEVYSILFNLLCESEKVKFVKYLYCEPDFKDYFYSLNETKTTAAACYGGNSEIVRFLEQEKLNFDANSLKRAFLSKNFDLFYYLLYNKIVDINEKNENGETLFNTLVRINYYDLNHLFTIIEEVNEELDNSEEVEEKLFNIEQIKKTLNNKEEINEVLKNEEEIREMLNNKIEIDFNTQNNRGYTALHYAIINSNFDTVEFLLQKSEIDLNIQNNAGFTPFYFAIYRGVIKIVELLLEKQNLDLNINDNNNTSLIHYAALSKNKEMFNFLLSKRLLNINDINNKDNFGKTPLHYAIENNNNGLINFLINQPIINLNVKDNKNKTLIHYAVENKNFELVRFLITRTNININDKDNNNETPLHVAVKKIFSSEKVIKNDSIEALIAAFLINHPMIRLNEKNNNGETPLSIIASDSYFEYNNICKLLIEKGAEINVNNFNLPLRHAVLHNNEKMIKFLIDNGADFNVEINYNNFGYSSSLLMEAIRNQDIYSIKLLAKYKDKIDINKKYSNRTALTEAIKVKGIDLVKVLIEDYGAIVTDYDIMEAEGKNEKSGNHYRRMILRENAFEFRPKNMTDEEIKETLVNMLKKYKLEQETRKATQELIANQQKEEKQKQLKK